MEGPTCGLSQQAAEAGGSLILETQGWVGSSPDNDGTGRHRQTARVRQARREGVRMQKPVVEPPQAGDTGSNLTDLGRAAVSGRPYIPGRTTSDGVEPAVTEATRKGCGVLVARLQGKSWAPPPSIGQW